MAENKPTGAAGKVAQSIKTGAQEQQQQQQQQPSSNENIHVGATVGGSQMQNAAAPAGVQDIKRAPGYYSRHAGKVRIGQKVWLWPMEAPLVPKEDETELKEFLDSMVERRLAEKVE